MHASRRPFFLAAGAVAILAAGGGAWAWHGQGHDLAARSAVRAARSELPAFFVAGAGTVAHCALDPDLFTRPIGPEPLNSTEGPEHFFDVEMLRGAKPPASRYEYLALCCKMGLKPNRVGLLPYAVTEWTQRLTVAFAEHRARPADEHIRAKCLVYAGILSHYAADLTQPLHVTIHWDGRARADGSSPRSGIHAKIDALPDRLSGDREALVGDLEPAALSDLLAGVLAEIGRSHALVERVYQLADAIPAGSGPLPADSAVAQFTADRMRAAGRFTASLYLTAWKDSAAIKLPAWYKRPDDDGWKKARE